MSDPDDRLDVLRGAILDLDAGRTDRVIGSLGELPDEGGPMGRGLRLLAQGLVLESEGDSSGAARLHEQAFGFGSALPAVALRELAASFRRNGRHTLAHHAFLMHHLLEPGALDWIAEELAPAERARYATWALRSSWWSRANDLYGLAEFKRALRDRMGPEAAALVLAGLSAPDGPRMAVRRPLSPLIDHARDAGIDYEEVVPAGPVEPIAVPLFGQAMGSVDAGWTRALFRCVLEDVVVSARSGILVTGERALIDVQDDELESRPHDLSVDPVVAAAGPHGADAILLEPVDRDAVRRIPEAMWLGGVHSTAFGHWLLEFLPKVWANVGRPDVGQVPLLVDAHMPPQHVEAVRFFLGDANPVIELEDRSSVRVDRLWVTSALAYLPVGPLPDTAARKRPLGLPRDGFARLMERIAPALEGVETDGVPARLYLGRKPSQHRRLAASDEIERLVVDAGFEKVDFGELPFREQVRLVRGAEWIIGPGGSAGLATIFGRPGLRVGVLVPLGASDVAWLAQACDVLGIDLMTIVGRIETPHPRYLWMSDFTIDPSVLAAYLADPSDAAGAWRSQAAAATFDEPATA